MPAPLLLISGVCLIILLLVLLCPRSFSIRVYSDRKCLVRHGIFINLVICGGLSFCRYRAVMSMSINGDVLLSLVRVRRVILRRLVGSLIVGVTMMKQLPLLSCTVLRHP